MPPIRCPRDRMASLSEGGPARSMAYVRGCKALSGITAACPAWIAANSFIAARSIPAAAQARCLNAIRRRRRTSTGSEAASVEHNALASSRGVELRAVGFPKLRDSQFAGAVSGHDGADLQLPQA
jgi:hypothetical protein